MLKYRDASLKLNANVNAVISMLCAWMILFLLGSLFFNMLFIYGILGVGILLLVVNWDLLRFFVVKKGIIFAMLSMVCLFVYYINCGICVFVGPFYYAQTNEKN